MPQHKKIITWETVCLWNLTSFYHVTKEKKSKKFYESCDLKTSSRLFCVCKELSTTSISKWNFWSKLLIFDKKQQNYQNLANAGLLRFFLQRTLRKLKRPGTSFQSFSRFFGRKFYFLMLHELAEFHNQTVFISHVTQAVFISHVISVECKSVCQLVSETWEHSYFLLFS